MKRLMDSKLKLLGDDQSTIKGLFVGVEIQPKTLSVGDAMALSLNIEDDGKKLVFVFGQTRRDELHCLTVMLPVMLF